MSDSPDALGTTEVNAGPAGVYYVDNRGPVLGNGLWVYMESNGIFVDRGVGVYHNDPQTERNLQRGGASPYVPDDAEICVDEPGVAPDSLVL